ncbi:zinc ribbon domain-containing protein [Paenibacillus chungangensis]|uniref:Zinc ribbon domain-containing protein n=1 Tax=Paenibacillus chungangensis TaxID=696535 RepID=A0ABW3HP00_9BACL
MNRTEQTMDAICQSCSMPMTASEQYGTEKDGTTSADYCRYCYKDGAFTQAEFTMQDMIAFDIPFMVKDGMEESQARTLLQSIMPRLKRWSPQEAGSGSAIQPDRYEELPSFTLAGISVVTTNEAEFSGEGKIGKLYEQYYAQNIGGQLAPHQQKLGHYGCYFNYEQGDAGRYELMVGVQVREAEQDSLPEAVKAFTAPAAKYAVFVTERGPIIEMVQRAWAGIWQWSRQPGNERAFTGDFEYYGPDINPEDGQAEIYIAVR